MDYIRTETDGQLALTQTTEWLHFPSALHGFHNTNTTRERAESGRNVFCFHGLLDIPEEERTCRCGARMHINGHPTITLRHLCIGGNLSCLMFPHNQLKCPACGATKTQSIPLQLSQMDETIQIPVVMGLNNHCYLSGLKNTS